VSNDIALNAGSRFYLITGSNMAGKSTMLRTAGLNAVIALAGGPVRAAQNTAVAAGGVRVASP
jgi:DNA mismatch repair ATPase MutS